MAVVAVAILLTSSATAQNLDLEAASWLAGCWDATSGETVVEEQWMSPRGGLMMGMSRTIRAGVATGHEFVLIRRTDAGLVYSAYPSGQPPAEFTASVATDRELRFVNPSHDFPRKIEYHKNAADRVVAKVYGEVDAMDPAFELHYERVRCTGGEAG